ncbi:unnamed protein product [Calicophoron daubneyi]|uniref:Acylamino-acid-releasing enzyme n=1 Tax=Calicophoron daubneyi TaxID=300641 RepID=A0AAV2TPQ1_CALDB
MSSTSVGVVDRISKIYARFATVPTVKRSKLLSVLGSTSHQKFSLTVEWKQLDFQRKDNTTFCQTYFLSTEKVESRSLSLDHVSEPCFSSLGLGFPFPKENGAHLVWELCLDEQRLRAVCIEYARNATMLTSPAATRACCPEPGAFVQIWSDGRQLKNIKLPTSGPTALHGRIYSDGNPIIGGASWSPDGTHIVYVAESAREEFEDTKVTVDSSPFRHQEDWGEGLADVIQPVICVLDVSTGSVSRLTDFGLDSSSYSPSCPVWCPDGTGIVFLGYALEAYRLGLIYCTNRKCRVYHYDFRNKQCRGLSDPNQAALCPRFSPDGKFLVWLEHPLGGPHRQPHSLVKMSWPYRKEVHPVTVISQSEKDKVPEGFPGLFGELPKQCWTADSSCVLMSSEWGCRTIPLLIPVSTSETDCSSKVYILPDPLCLDCAPDNVNGRSLSCIDILDVTHDVITSCIHSPGHPPALALLPLSSFPFTPSEYSQFFSYSNWLLLQAGTPHPGNKLPHVSGIEWTVSPSIINADPNWRRTESILIHPIFGTQGLPEAVDIVDDNLSKSTFWEPLEKPSKLHGLIVWPHGGPHSVFPAAWSPKIASFLAAGFACLLVNYRGSLGYGEAQTRCLLGKIGDADVADCVEATKTALNYIKDKLGPIVPPVLFGGSHGGFLTLHLAARYASLYQVAVARNPVAHLVSSIDTSDIPDWVYAETGACSENVWELGHIANTKDLTRFLHMSPLCYVTPSWNVPLLLCLGGKDRRVPLSQGMTFYRKLKALCPAVPCEAFVYPHDSHPLDSAATDIDVFLNTILWYYKHLSVETAS